MKRYITILALGGLLYGCTSILWSSTETINSPSIHDKKWAISAKDDSSPFSDAITLYVNGTQVASGSLNPHRHSADLTGSYEQHSILGDCSIVGAPRKSLASWGGYQCIVYVDGSKVTDLLF